ncbi:hypothetical protein Ndes2526B_g04557 [Nannochloris sp. 'desiccata']
MESFWKSALDAAEKAKAVAKSVSQKGIEFAEATAEEAGKKFKDLNLSSTITSSTSPKPTAPSETELISYGITSRFIEFIRSLNYNTFRDFSAGKAAGPTEAPASGEDAPDAPSLNAWQVRHAMLVVRAVKEVNELRYVLCPRYMPDQQFWEVYFALAASHLPAVASTWREGDSLPPVAGANQATAATKGNVGTGGVELTSLLPLGGSFGGTIAAAADSTSGSGMKGVLSEGTSHSARGGALLETDPDLEAYLQTADDEREGTYHLDCSEGGGGTDNGLEKQLQFGEDTGDTEDDDDLDLDQYLNELSAEVGDAEEVGEEDTDGGNGEVDDVEAALRVLQDEI